MAKAFVLVQPLLLFSILFYKFGSQTHFNFDLAYHTLSYLHCPIHNSLPISTRFTSNHIPSDLLLSQLWYTLLDPDPDPPSPLSNDSHAWLQKYTAPSFNPSLLVARLLPCSQESVHAVTWTALLTSDANEAQLTSDANEALLISDAVSECHSKTDPGAFVSFKLRSSRSNTLCFTWTVESRPAVASSAAGFCLDWIMSSCNQTKEDIWTAAVWVNTQRLMEGKFNFQHFLQCPRHHHLKAIFPDEKLHISSFHGVVAAAVGATRRCYCSCTSTQLIRITNPKLISIGLGPCNDVDPYMDPCISLSTCIGLFHVLMF